MADGNIRSSRSQPCADAGTHIPRSPSRPAICVLRDADSHVVTIDASQEAGRAALERWSYIDPAERAKWATPYAFRSAEMEAFYARGSK